jgi:hypothetical protein
MRRPPRARRGGEIYSGRSPLWRPPRVIFMDDAQIAQRITELADEEHALERVVGRCRHE